MSIKDNIYTKTCFNKILKANCVYDVENITPVQPAPKISSKFNNNFVIKREGLTTCIFLN